MTDEPEVAAFEPTPVFAAHSVMPLTPEASPDGSWLAYLLEAVDGSINLWLSPTDGGDPQQVELPFEPLVERDPDSGRLIRGPQWSPDGTTLAIAGSVDGEDRTGIWLVPSPVHSNATPLVVAAVADDSEDGETAPESDAETPVETENETAPDADVASALVDAPEGDVAEAPVEVEPVVAEITDAVTAVAEPTEAAPDSRCALAHLGPGIRALAALDARWQSIAFVSNRDGRDAIALATTMGDEPTIAELLTWSDRRTIASRSGRAMAGSLPSPGSAAKDRITPISSSTPRKPAS